MWNPDLPCKEKGWNLVNGSRSLDHTWSCSHPPSHSTLSLCNLGRNPTQCQVVYSLGSQICVFFFFFFLYHWLKNPSIFLPSSERFQEKNNNRWLGQYYLRDFRDNPHLFGQAFSWDLLDLDLGPNGKILQYIDDLPICSPDEKNTQPHAIQFLNFLAATAAKSLQSCPTLCDPIDSSPPGSSVHGILQARTLELVAISSSNAWKWKVKVKSLSRVRLLETPWTAAHQAPLSMGFSRQEYWSGVPLPSPKLFGREGI